MEFRDLVLMQRHFDERRRTNFGWSEAITDTNTHPLLHNVLSLVGESGEVANLAKKFDRGDFDFQTLMAALPGELADVAIYLIKIAYQCDIDLESAILDKIALNEKRFPEGAQVSDDQDLSALDSTQRQIVQEAVAAAERASSEDLSVLMEAYRKCGVAAPIGGFGAAFGGALLALRFVKAAVYEGNPEMRDSAWKGLEPVASLFGLDRAGISSLTAAEDDLRLILGCPAEGM